MRIDWNKQLEFTGKVVAFGWGDEVLNGLLIGYLEKATPEGLAECINQNKRLLDSFSERQLQLLRRIGQSLKFDGMTSKDIRKTLRADAPALSLVLDFHPKGMTWLDSQIADIKKTLASS